MARQDPFHGFRFLVEFDRVQKGGFSREDLLREVREQRRANLRWKPITKAV